MTIKEIRKKTGLSQVAFAKEFNIPRITLQSWERGVTSPTGYLAELIEFKAIVTGLIHDGNTEEFLKKHHFYMKKKLVLLGESRVFNDWHEHSGISKDDFINGLIWICSDPGYTYVWDESEMKWKLTAESAEEVKAAGKEVQWLLSRELGIDDDGNLHLLKRLYYENCSFAGFFESKSTSFSVLERWNGYVSISANDRI